MSHSVLPRTSWYKSQGWKSSMDPLCRLEARSTRAVRCWGSHRPQVVRECGSILQDSDLSVSTALQGSRGGAEQRWSSSASQSVLAAQVCSVAQCCTEARSLPDAVPWLAACCTARCDAPQQQRGHLFVLLIDLLVSNWTAAARPTDAACCSCMRAVLLLPRAASYGHGQMWAC